MGLQIANLNVGIGADTRDFDAIASKLEKSLRPLQQRTEKIGKALSKYVTGGAIAAAAAIGGLAMKSAAAADRIDKMSQRLGISRQAFQELDFVLSQNGASIDSMQMGMKTLSVRMDEAFRGVGEGGRLFEALGVSVMDATGQMKNQEEAFFETIRALQGVEQGVQKAALAQKIFGRNGQELLPILNQNKGSLDELRQKARDLGLIMGDDTVDAGVRFTDTMDQLKRQVSISLNEIGVKFIPLIERNLVPLIRGKVVPALRGFADRIQAMVDWWTNLNPILKTGIKVVAGIAVAMGPLLLAFSKFITFLPIASKAVTLFGISTKAALISSGIGIAVVALGAAAYALWKNWDYVSQKLTIAFNTMAAVGLKMVEGLLSAINRIPGVSRLFPGLQRAIDFVGDAADRSASKAMDARAEFAKWREEQNKDTEQTDDLAASLTNANTGMDAHAMAAAEIVKVYESLSEETGKLKNRQMVLGSSFDMQKEEIRLLEDAMIGLLNNGISPTDAGYLRLKNRLDALRLAALAAEGPLVKIRGLQDAPSIGGPTTEGGGMLIDPDMLRRPVEEGAEAVQPGLDSIRERFVNLHRRLQETVPQIANTVKQGFDDAATGMLEGIGRMVAGSGSFGDVVRNLLTTLADLAVRVGKIAIGVGAGVAGIKTALKSLNPAAAIIAGAALITLGTAAKSALNSAASGGGSGAATVSATSGFGEQSFFDRPGVRNAGDPIASGVSGRAGEIPVRLIVESHATPAGDIAYSFSQGSRLLERRGTDER